MKSNILFLISFFVSSIDLISGTSNISLENLKLETQSVFYGLALTASQKGNRGRLCQNQLSDVAAAVRNKTRWAIKLLDASGVPQSGLYWGGTFWLGSQSQCDMYTSGKKMSASPSRVVHYRDSAPPFKIAYYAAYFKHNSNIQKIINWPNENLVTLGLCLPYSCSEQEISELLQEYFNTGVLFHQHVYNMTFAMEGVKKVNRDMSWIWTPKYSIVLITTALLVILNIAGTIYSAYFYEESSVQHLNNRANGVVPHQNGTVKKKEATKPIKSVQKILLGFSVSRNIRTIFNIDYTRENLRILNGVRVIVMIMMIRGHAITYAKDKYEAKQKLFYLEDGIVSQMQSKGHLLVDVFLCIGGFVLGHSFFKNPKNNTNISPNLKKIVVDYLHGVCVRFMRLTPIYMYVLLLTQALGEYRFRASSLWNNERMDVRCSKYWWTNLLYINNIYPRLTECCMTWSYYVANDMQCFIVASLLLHLARRYFKLSALIGVALCVASSLITAYLVKSMNIIPYDLRLLKIIDILYSPSWMLISSYIIGVFGAYFYCYHRDFFYSNKIKVYLGWIMFPLACSFALFGLKSSNESSSSSIMYNMLYLSTSRPLWAVALIWLNIICLTGRAGMFGKMLSLDAWLPLARVTYCAYLINPTLVSYFTTMNDKNMYFDYYGVMLNALGLMVVVFIVSMMLAILVEYPMHNLVYVISRKRTENTAGTIFINPDGELKQD